MGKASVIRTPAELSVPRVRANRLTATRRVAGPISGSFSLKVSSHSVPPGVRNQRHSATATTTATTPSVMPIGDRSVSVTPIRMRVGRGSWAPVSPTTPMIRGRMKIRITRIDRKPNATTISG